MTNLKQTKKALLTSVLSLFLCFTMLLGTTYAWFTDSVSSANNIITAGNLDVELKYYDGSKWEDVTSETNVFKKDTLWEPGHTEVVYLQVSNVGSLALKYNLSVNVAAETAGVNKNGNTFKLSNYIEYQVVDLAVTEETFAAYADRNAALEAMIAPTKLANKFSKASSIVANGASEFVAIIVNMPEEVGNIVNHDGNTVPKIELGINVAAMQYTAESDSFDNLYDVNSIFCDILATPETIDEILATAEEGTIIGLATGYYDEITLTQNDLTLVSAPNCAVVGFLNLNAKDGATIDNITFDQSGAKETYTFRTGNTQTATGYVANITGDIDSPKAADNAVIKNCTFTNTSGVALAAATQFIPVYFNEQGAATERCDSITIDNCVFACDATQYLGLNYLAEGDVVITNNKFGGSTYGTAHNTISATGNAASWTITGNTFFNWNIEKTAIGSSKQGSNIVTWTITDNNFCNDDSAYALALKTSYTAANSVVVFENNKLFGGDTSFVQTTTNAENEAIYVGYKIEYTNVNVANGSSDQITINENEATNVNISSGSTVGSSVINKGVMNLNGNGGTISVGNAGLENLGDATVSNLTMNAGSPVDYSNITRGQDANTVYNNVIVNSAGGGVAAANGGQAEFNSGSVAVNSTSTSGRYIFYAEGQGSVITINDGTFSFSKTLNQKRAYIYAGAGTTVYVNGGTFGPASTRSGYTAGIMGPGTVIITGGTFGFDPSNWVADGYQAVKTGTTWTVSAI